MPKKEPSQDWELILADCLTVAREICDGADVDTDDPEALVVDVFEYLVTQFFVLYNNRTFNDPHFDGSQKENDLADESDDELAIIFARHDANIRDLRLPLPKIGIGRLIFALGETAHWIMLGDVPPKERQGTKKRRGTKTRTSEAIVEWPAGATEDFGRSFEVHLAAVAGRYQSAPFGVLEELREFCDLLKLTLEWAACWSIPVRPDDVAYHVFDAFRIYRTNFAHPDRPVPPADGSLGIREAIHHLERLGVHVEKEINDANSAETKSEFENNSTPDARSSSQCSHSDDFSSVVWYGSIYRFTGTQARIIDVLWKQWAKSPGLSMRQSAIAEKADITKDEFKMSHSFRVGKAGSRRQHEAWEAMIHSDGQGSFWLEAPKYPQNPR